MRSTVAPLPGASSSSGSGCGAGQERKEQAQEQPMAMRCVGRWTMKSLARYSMCLRMGFLTRDTAPGDTGVWSLRPRDTSPGQNAGCWRCQMGFVLKSVAIVCEKNSRRSISRRTRPRRWCEPPSWRVQATREGLPGADRLLDGARRTRKTPLICDWGRVRSRAS